MALTQIRTRLVVGAIAMGFCALVTDRLLIRTAWGHQVDFDAYFGSVVAKRSIARFEGSILDILTPTSAIILLVLLCLLAWSRGLLRVSLLLSATVIGAWVGAELCKHYVGWQPLIADDARLPVGLQAMTAPSGHTTAFTGLALAFAITSAQRWRRRCGLGAAFVSASAGLAVVIAGWHRASDAIIGICWAGLCMSLAVLLMSYLGWFDDDATVGPEVADDVSGARLVFASITLAVGQLACVVALALLAPDSGPDADRPYLALSAITLVCAYSVCPFLVATTARMPWRIAEVRQRQ